MNFNRNNTNDYSLKSRNINEMINLYGVEIDWLFTSKENIDSVLGDFSHLSLTDNQSRKVAVMPEDTEGFDGDVEYGMFGVMNARNTILYISRSEIIRLYPDFDDSKGYNGILNQLVVFPSGKIMEITDFDDQVPGQNNLYAYKDQKSAYAITCVPYSFNKQDDIDDEPLEEVTEQIANIDEYFADLEIVQDDVDVKAKEISNSDSVFGSLG